MNGKKVILALFLMASFVEMMPMNGPEVRVYGSEGEGQAISVPVAILMESPVIKSMIEDVGTGQAIPLTGSIQVIQDIVEILKNPSRFDEIVGGYSLDDLVERFTFLNHYDIDGNIMTLFTNEIAKKGVGVKAPLNNDVKKRLFIDPAIAQLKNIMIQKQSATDENQLVKLAEPPKGTRIRSVVFTPNGKKMFTGVASSLEAPRSDMINAWSFGDDGKIKQLNNSMLASSLIKSVNGLAINDNGSILAARVEEKQRVYNALIWQLDNDGNIITVAQKLTQDQNANNRIEHIVFHPNGNIITVNRNLLSLWISDGNGGFSEQPQILDILDPISDIKISSNGKVMVTSATANASNNKNLLLLWVFNDDGTINPKPQSFDPHPTQYDSIELNQDGTMMVANHSKVIRVFDLKNLENVTYKSIMTTKDERFILAMSHDYKKIATSKNVERNSLISICDTNGRSRKEFSVPTQVLCLKFTPDNENLILSSSEGLFVRSLLSQGEKKLLADLSKTLTADQAQLIIKLSRAASIDQQEALSDAERKIYDELSPVIQDLFKDNIR